MDAMMGILIMGVLTLVMMTSYQMLGINKMNLILYFQVLDDFEQRLDSSNYNEETIYIMGQKVHYSTESFNYNVDYIDFNDQEINFKSKRKILGE